MIEPQPDRSFVLAPRTGTMTMISVRYELLRETWRTGWTYRMTQRFIMSPNSKVHVTGQPVTVDPTLVLVAIAPELIGDG